MTDSQIAHWFITKWRIRLAECHDILHVAKMMKKQGIPAEIAAQILARPLM
ncbi:MAG TPA: hypothetical protein PLN42_06600 [Anaerolineae bacterium]|nr:hypothetical protein [Anaerolineae bacterium]